MANFGKINLTAFKNSSVQIIDGKKSVVIPVEDNFLFEANNGNIYIDIVNFKSEDIKPFTHKIIRSVPEKYREELKYKTKIGGIKL